MAFPTVKSYATLVPITSLTVPPTGHVFRTPRVNQGPARGSWIYNFFLTGTSTPANVYQDGNLTTPFSPTGVVTADAFGRFPAIYLDNSVAYKVQLLNASSVVQRTTDPYYPPMATTGYSQLAAIGLTINAQGELTMTEASSGGNGTELSVSSPTNGGPALAIRGNTPGVAYLIIDNSVTTGAQTATFAASNLPGAGYQLSVTATAAPAGATYTGGTLTSSFTGITSSAYTIVLSTGQVILGCTFTNGSTTFTTPSTSISGTPSATFVVTFSTGVAGWLPIRADGVTYYTPIFNATGFTPYKYVGSVYQGQIISAATVTLNGDGTVTLTGSGASASPATYYQPPQSGIGGSTWINITKTSGLAGASFSAAQGTWTNITTGGLTIANNTGNTTITGTYQLSTSNTGSPLVGSGTISLTGSNGAQTQNMQNGFEVFNSNGTITEQGGTAPTNWYLPTTASIGTSYWINFATTSGTLGGATAGTWNQLTSGLNVYPVAAIGGSGGTLVGSYQISTTNSSSGLVASGNITLGGVTSCPVAQTFNPTSDGGSWTFATNGAVSGPGTGGNWYSPTTTNIGTTGGYYITFSLASSSGSPTWTGPAFNTPVALSSARAASATFGGPGFIAVNYQISTSATGSPVCAQGQLSLTNEI